MADAEVLLHDISDFGDGLVTQDLRVGQLGGGGVLAHDAVFDLIEGEKVPVGFSGVAFIGIDLFDFLLGMTTERRAVGQEVGIVDRGRSQCGGQHKAVAGVHRGMFLQPKVRGIIFDYPVGLEITGELQRLAVFIVLPLFGLAVFAVFFQLVVAQGAAGGLDQAGVHGNALVDGKPLLLELTQDLGVDRVYGGFGQSAAEAGEGGVIRCGLAEGQAQKGFEGESVVDLVFQLGVGLNAEPLLKQQAFEKHQRRVGTGAFLAGAHGVVAEQDGFDTRPVDGAAELLHELDAAVLFQAVGQGKVGEIQAAGGLFESHVCLLS
jgi:hypothetical protein